jgi:purine-binding chemotaxis protein CheW
MGKRETAPAEKEWTPPEVGRAVVFYMDGQRYGVPIDRVQEIQQLVAFSELPDSSPALVGLINMRGLVVPVIDLRLLVGLPAAPYGVQTPMVVCRKGTTLVALVVDEVEDVLEMPAGCLSPPTKLYALAEKMLGVCRMESDFVFVLDLDALMPEGALSTFSGGLAEQEETG